MGGINSLNGLNKVNVDFQPTITTNVQNTGNANQPQPGADAVPEEAPQLGNAKSVVQQLDVLLVNAAGKSVSADAVKNVKKVGESLTDLGVLTQEEKDKLESLAKDATAKLKALDKFSGRELAEALMKDENTAKAVKAAIESQQALSAEIERLGQRLARNDQVDAELQNAFTEVQFQCDRRVSEIDSIVFKMYQLVHQDAVENPAADPKTTALLNATFKELMPREAIMGHGTAESLEIINKTFGERMRPLAEKLDAFAADGSKVLSGEDILALQRDMADMKSALENVRKNGLNETVMTNHEGKEIFGENGVAITKMTEVDSSLLDEMEKLLADVSNQIADARNVSVMRSRQVFLEEVKAMLSPESVPGGDKVMSSSAATSNNIVFQFKLARKEFVELIRDYSLGTLPMEDFDTNFNECIVKLCGLYANLASALVSVGVDEATAQDVAKAVKGIRFVKAQFRALLEAGERIKNGGEDPGLATIDVRRIRAQDHARRGGAFQCHRGEDPRVQAGRRRSRYRGVEHSRLQDARLRYGGEDLSAEDEVRRKARLQVRVRQPHRHERHAARHERRLQGRAEDGEPEPRHAGHRQGVRLRGPGGQVFRRQPQGSVRLFHGEGRGLRGRRIL